MESADVRFLFCENVRKVHGLESHSAVLSGFVHSSDFDAVGTKIIIDTDNELSDFETEVVILLKLPYQTLAPAHDSKTLFNLLILFSTSRDRLKSALRSNFLNMQRTLFLNVFTFSVPKTPQMIRIRLENPIFAHWKHKNNKFYEIWPLFRKVS